MPPLRGKHKATPAGCGARAASFVAMTETYDASLLEAMGLPGDARARADALNRYAKLGVPTPKLEAWHFTSLKALDEAALAPSDAKIAPLGS